MFYDVLVAVSCIAVMLFSIYFVSFLISGMICLSYNLIRNLYQDSDSPKKSFVSSNEKFVILSFLFVLSVLPLLFWWTEYVHIEYKNDVYFWYTFNFLYLGFFCATTWFVIPTFFCFIRIFSLLLTRRKQNITSSFKIHTKYEDIFTFYKLLSLIRNFVVFIFALFGLYNLCLFIFICLILYAFMIFPHISFF